MIAAAGSGERLGAGGPKAFVEVAGRPLLAWALEAVREAGSVGEVVVAAPPGDQGRAAGLAEEAGMPEAIVVAGGEVRSQSVTAALERAGGDPIVIHDAARPLVSAELIEEVVGALAGHPDAEAAIAAAAIADTVKRAAERRPPAGELPEAAVSIAETLDRERLWAAQTPQAFRAEALRRALAVDPERARAATDEAMLIEQGGGRVVICPAPATNLKVTTAEDVRVAEALLRDRAR